MRRTPLEAQLARELAASGGVETFRAAHLRLAIAVAAFRAEVMATPPGRLMLAAVDQLSALLRRLS